MSKLRLIWNQNIHQFQELHGEIAAHRGGIQDRGDLAFSSNPQSILDGLKVTLQLTDENIRRVDKVVRNSLGSKKIIRAERNDDLILTFLIKVLRKFL